MILEYSNLRAVLSTPSPSACYDGDADGRDYRGQRNFTASGLACQNWLDMSPHAHQRSADAFPDMGLGDHNFCRNPDQESAPWCYTTDENVLFELCEVCSDPEEPQLVQDLNQAELDKLLRIDASTGQIFPSQTFEELRGTVILNVSVSDQSEPERVSFLEVTVNIIDVRPGDDVVLCNRGVVALTGAACSCEGSFCSSCTVDRVTLEHQSCVECSNARALFEGSCFDDCNSFTGYELVGSGPIGRQCLPINNCDTDNGGCGGNSTCTFIGPGTNDCECFTNFTGTDEGTNCEAINPCDQSDGFCMDDTVCVFTGPGQRRCDCMEGFEFGTEENACVIDERLCIGGMEFFEGTTSSCTCTENCFGCINTVFGTECQTCSSSKYLFNGTCHDDCSAFPNTVMTGDNEFGRICDAVMITTTMSTTQTTTTPAEVACFGTVTGSGVACSCPDSCVTCTVILQGSLPSSDVCELCGDSKFLLEGECLDSCPPGTDPVGEALFGRQCVPRSTTATTTAVPVLCNGRSDTEGNACSCGFGCAQCRVEDGDNPCTLCGSSLFLFDGVCNTNCDAFDGFVEQPGSGRTGGICVRQ